VSKSHHGWVLTLIVAGCILSGCVVIPARDGLARVHVGDVVKRIKCDIAEVVFNKSLERTPDGRTPFVFLSNWAARIHLTIAVDDMVSVNPGATITSPLDKTVATALIPATVETFSLGIGAGLTTEAVRTEDVEFLVSFSDMIAEFNNPSKRGLYNNCQFDKGTLLESDLGLAALVNSSLEPIGSGVLYTGNNVGPGAAPPAIPIGQLNDIAKQLKDLKSASGELPKPQPNETISDLANLTQKSKFNFLIKQFNIQTDQTSKSESQFKQEQGAEPNNVTSVKTILVYAGEASTEEIRTQSIINNIVKPLYAIASTSLDASCLTKATQSQFQAITWSAKVSLNVIDVDNAITEADAKTSLEAEEAAKNKVIDFTTEMMSEIAACSKVAKKPIDKGPPQYDPIDVISETVNFYVTGSGSVTPTWRLVQVTAPLASSFLSGSRKDTNTLILAMGRPAPTANGGIISSSVMDRQILSSILSQAILSRPAGP
jgi:hypothetical protein